MAEPASLTQQTRQIAGFLKSLSGKQKLWLVAGAVVVAGLLYVFVGLLSKPERKPLYTGLKPQDAQALGAKLATQKIDYQISSDGTTVSVAADKLDAARLQVAADGGMKSGRMGFELFDKTNWAGSDFSEKVNYQRALEGELERTLQSIDGVDAVRVHLVLPQESLFADNQSEAKASVILRMRGSLSPNNDVAIRRLVAGAVEKLHPQNVTVIDAENNMPIGLPEGGTSSGAETARDQVLAKELVRTLEPIIGEGGVRASVHVEYDETSGDETQESYDPANPATLTLQKSEETLGGTLAQGVPGTASNIPNTTSPAKNTSASSDTQNSRSESATYGVNKMVRHVLLPAGRVKRITAALLVDDAIAITNGKSVRTSRRPEDLKKIETLARAALGILDARGDVIAVESLSFRESIKELPQPPSRMEKILHVLRAWSWMLRYILISLLFLAVYTILVRPVRKQIVQSFRELPSRAASGAVLSGDTGQVLSAMPDRIDPMVKQTAQLKKQLVEKAKAEPANASQLVQNWLREEQA